MKFSWLSVLELQTREGLTDGQTDKVQCVKDLYTDQQKLYYSAYNNG